MRLGKDLLKKYQIPHEQFQLSVGRQHLTNTLLSKAGMKNGLFPFLNEESTSINCSSLTVWGLFWGVQDES